jgi:RNA polymerase sigma-70 factor (ECF subfamily)
MTDHTDLIIQARRGDDTAFTIQVETYQGPVYNLCYRMLGEYQAAEDAAQETFLKVYQNLTHYDLERSFATWLISIASHYCIDRLRQGRFYSYSLDNERRAELPDPSAIDPERETTKRLQQERLQNCLNFLDPINRAAVILCYWQDCSEEEIANTLHLTVSAVKSRLHRSRRELANIWNEEPAHWRRERNPGASPVF